MGEKEEDLKEINEILQFTGGEFGYSKNGERRIKFQWEGKNNYIYIRPEGFVDLFAKRGKNEWCMKFSTISDLICSLKNNDFKKKEKLAPNRKIKIVFCRDREGKDPYLYDYCDYDEFLVKSILVDGVMVWQDARKKRIRIHPDIPHMRFIQEVIEQGREYDLYVPNTYFVKSEVPAELHAATYMEE